MEEIKKLIESRQIEASKKQISVKCLCVAKYLGNKIYGDSGFGSGYSASTLDTDYWDQDSTEDAIREADMDDYADLGYIYDALTIGKNLEIRYMAFDKEIRIQFNGHVVYLEIDGRLNGYHPGEEWESVLVRLYERAKIIEASTKIKEKEEQQKSFIKRAGKFLNELRETWGF